MPSSRAARHWLPLFSCNTVEMNLLLKFTNRFRIKNIASVHLQDEGFELISHGVSLSLSFKLLSSKLLSSIFYLQRDQSLSRVLETQANSRRSRHCLSSRSMPCRTGLRRLRRMPKQIQSLIKPYSQLCGRNPNYGSSHCLEIWRELRSLQPSGGWCEGGHAHQNKCND